MIEAALAVLAVLGVWAAGWALARFRLQGLDLSSFDLVTGEHFNSGASPSDEHRAVVASLKGLREALRGVPVWRHIAVLRRYMDELFPHDRLNASFTPIEAADVRGEWVLAPGADPRRRTLYIHGGAFSMGSPRSHRRLTSRFAEITGGAVFAVDYRLLPEHRRLAGIDDCRAAYRWLLEHGPQGSAPAQRIWVAGDSAGGNLTLSLIAWVRDTGLRAPDAAVAFSPLTDATLASPSLRSHVRTDPMLGPLFGRLARVPQHLLLWLGWWQNRIRPADPRISPVFGDLSRLPPTLVQASAAEMLHDDARRYVNRARAAGSPVQLQTWAHMVHVWQLFHPELPEGARALDEVQRFIANTEQAMGSRNTDPRRTPEIR
ncbi:MAG: alpha/beta hydrolase [Ideonella sp.]|nr:alpha/beta hydrolase [Ideonella sp.]